MTVTTDTLQRETLDWFLRRTSWSFVLKETAAKRWDVTVRIAERGTFKDVPVKAWTNTSTGTIFLREEIFDGIDLTNSVNRRTIQTVMEFLVDGTPINRENVTWGFSSLDAKETAWRIAQTVAAAYGVFGHEYGHAAYSEHTGRHAFHMGLEDLRNESLWMAQDPIRARQGLRACAANWVLHDSSPMTGTKEFDLTKVKSHASLLHLYLLIVGRGRIGVLDDQSKLVVGIRDLAAQVLGWQTVSDANDIIDRFLETAEDPLDLDGVTQREALAEEFSRLLPQDAGEPDSGIGCFCEPKASGTPGPGQGQSKSKGEGQSKGEGKDESDTDDGEGEDDSDGKGGSQSDKESEDTGGGKRGTGDTDSPADDDDDKSQGSDGGDKSDEDGDAEGEGGSGSGDDDEGLTIGTNVGGGDADQGDQSEKEADFITGTFGETIRPGEEEVTDELDESDAYRLTQEQVEALAETLSEGLEEISSTEDGAGWAISNQAGEILKSRATAPGKVAGEVFSRKALLARNRRLKAATT